MGMSHLYEGTWLIVIMYIVSLWIVDCQTVRSFPPLFNVAKRQPVITQPAQSTCGVPVRNSFCRSNSSVGSVYECVQEFCVQECPRRTVLPVWIELLKEAQGYESCVEYDDVNTAPNSTVSSRSSLFLDKNNCFLIANKSPSMGANGAFTVTFWIWQESNNFG